MIKKVFAAGALSLLLSATIVNAQQANEKQNPERKSMFERLDANADGKISKAEADKAEKGRLKENFTKIDTNNDGFVTKDEMKIYRQNNPKPEHKGH